jgi:peptidoglycan DL-endopeptidase CwlO
MMARIPVAVRAGVALALLVVVVFVLLGYVGDYRSAKSQGSGESTGTAETTGTASAETTKAAGAGKSGTTTAKAATKTVETAAVGAVVTVQIEGLNFRSEPKAAGAVIRGLSKGERLTWIATENGWYKVTDKGGQVGWVSSSGQYATLGK